jgi:cyanate permease
MDLFTMDSSFIAGVIGMITTVFNSMKGLIFLFGGLAIGYWILISLVEGFRSRSEAKQTAQNTSFLQKLGYTVSSVVKPSEKETTAIAFLKKKGFSIIKSK